MEFISNSWIDGVLGPTSIDTTDWAGESGRHLVASFGRQGGSDSPPEVAYCIRIDGSFNGKFAVVDNSARSRFAQAVITPEAEATVNQGTFAPYPPVPWATRELSAEVARTVFEIGGVGLDHVSSIALLPPQAGPTSSEVGAPRQITSVDTLAVASRTPTALIAVSGTPLGAGSQLLLLEASGEVFGSVVLSEQNFSSSSAGGAHRMLPPAGFRAKDFAFIYAQDAFHIFYI